jgi:hypothetical protein
MQVMFIQVRFLTAAAFVAERDLASRFSSLPDAEGASEAGPSRCRRLSASNHFARCFRRFLFRHSLELRSGPASALTAQVLYTSVRRATGMPPSFSLKNRDPFAPTVTHHWILTQRLRNLLALRLHGDAVFAGATADWFDWNDHSGRLCCKSHFPRPRVDRMKIAQRFSAGWASDLNQSA